MLHSNHQCLLQTIYLVTMDTTMFKIWGSHSGGYEEWDIMSCSLLKVNSHFREICHLHLQGLTSKLSKKSANEAFNSQQTTWCWIP
jgi:hypothetical protein